jgi:hypothetical protein
LFDFAAGDGYRVTGRLFESSTGSNNMATKKKAKSVAAAIQPKPAVDLAKRAALADLAKSSVPVASPTDCINAFLSAKTTESQAALQACLEWYKHLARDEPDLVAGLASLVHLRQAYVLASRRVYDKIDQLRQKQVDDGASEDKLIPPELGDFIAQAAAHTASQPFDRRVAIHYVVETVMPFLAKIVDEGITADNVVIVNEEQAAAKVRAETPVPLGVLGSVPRKQSLVLAGWRNAVVWLIEHAVASLPDAAEPWSVVLLSSTPPKAREQRVNLVRLGPSQWHGCSNSDRSMAMTSHHVGPKMHRVDLIACSDLAKSFTQGFVGRPPGAQAGDGHRRLRRWCDQIGAAFLGGVLQDERDPPDIAKDFAFEQLRAFTTLQVVEVVERDTEYQFTVGPTVITAPKAEVDVSGGLLIG